MSVYLGAMLITGCLVLLAAFAQALTGRRIGNVLAELSEQATASSALTDIRRNSRARIEARLDAKAARSFGRR
jgi:hypothetical protein